jgi:dolichol kinase
MAQALALPADFVQASLLMRELLNQMHHDMNDFGSSTTEAIQDLRQNLSRSIEAWPETFDAYKASIHAMPRALKKQPFVKETLHQIEELEQNMDRFFAQVRQSSFQDFRKSIDRRVAETKESVDRMKNQIACLEADPLMQKFLRGEAVLASKKAIQWPRKLGHMFLGLSFLYLFIYSGASKSFVWSFTGVFLLAAFLLEISRHLNSRINDWVIRWFGPVMREAEKTRVNSAIFYILSILFVYFLFPVEVTILTLLFLSVGDPIAGMVGVKWGRHKISDQVSLEGSFACFLACSGLAALAAGVLFDSTLTGFSLLSFSLLSGLTGAVAESSFKKLDDNLVMPMLSAPILLLLLKLYSIL